MTLERWGWYPRGGGEVRLTIGPARRLTGVQWRTPAEISAFQALSAAAQLPEHVARRQAARVAARLGEAVPVAIVPAGGQDPGSLVFLWGPQGGVQRPGGPGQTRRAGGGRGGGGLPGLSGQRRRPGPPPGRPDADLPGPGEGSLQLHHRGGHLASAHQRLGHRAVFGADFEVRGNPGEPGEIFCQGQYDLDLMTFRRTSAELLLHRIYKAISGLGQVTSKRQIIWRACTGWTGLAHVKQG